METSTGAIKHAKVEGMPQQATASRWLVPALRWEASPLQIYAYVILTFTEAE
jgi:hypothetical protein